MADSKYVVPSDYHARVHVATTNAGTNQERRFKTIIDDQVKQFRTAISDGDLRKVEDFLRQPTCCGRTVWLTNEVLQNGLRIIPISDEVRGVLEVELGYREPLTKSATVDR